MRVYPWVGVGVQLLLPCGRQSPVEYISAPEPPAMVSITVVAELPGKVQLNCPGEVPAIVNTIVPLELDFTPPPAPPGCMALTLTINSGPAMAARASIFRTAGAEKRSSVEKSPAIQLFP